MTSEQLAAVKIGDRIASPTMQGSVTRAASTWFMVTWEYGKVEIVYRRPSWLTDTLELQA